jgi:hypothetical protein
MLNFNDDGYLIVPELLSKDLCEMVGRYLLLRQNTEPVVSDNQVPLAPHFYNDLFLETILESIRPIIEKKLDTELVPVNSYARIYAYGDELKPHKDRPGCEVSVTIMLFNRLMDESERWPIFMGNTPVFQKPGDAVIYNGPNINHYRKPFQGVYHIQAFFHYVYAEGIFAEYCRYDGRVGLGYPSRPNPYQRSIDRLDPNKKS